MKPWEVEKTREKIKKFSIEKSIKIFFDLYQTALKIIQHSLLNEENPHLSAKQLKSKINKLSESIGRL